MESLRQYCQTGNGEALGSVQEVKILSARYSLNILSHLRVDVVARKHNSR